MQRWTPLSAMFKGWADVQDLSVDRCAELLNTNRNHAQELLWLSRRPSKRIERNMRIAMNFETGEVK